MKDLIDRQQAIDAIKRNTFRLTFAEEQNCEGHVAWSAEAVYSDVMEGELLELPSAQPKIILCKDCKYWGSNGYCVYGSRLAWRGNYNDYCSRAEREGNE